MTDLPSGWAECLISDISELNPPLDRCPVSQAADVHFVPMPAVEAESGRMSVSQFRPYREVKKGYTSFIAGDVLFAKITPCMENGKVAVVPALTHAVAFGSTEFHVLRCKEGMSPSFVYYFVSAQAFRYEAEHNMTGAVGQKRVPTSFVADHSFPLPPSREQHRIVAKIEALFSELDKAVESLTLARAQLKTYRQALLDAATDGRLLTWKGQRNCPFGDDQLRPLFDLVKEMGQGWSPQCLNARAVDDKTWAVMKTTAIQHLAFDDTENKELPADITPRTHLELVEGDLLITRAGPRTRVGVACLVRSVRPRLILCDKAYRIRIRENLALPEYVELLLNAPRTLWEIEQIKSGISDSGLNLTQSKFLALQLFVPTLLEQRATLDHLSEVLSNVDRQEIEIDTAVAKANALRQSILKQAFSGQLVAQDPADEPAPALLARLRAEPATDRKPKSARRKRAV